MGAEWQSTATREALIERAQLLNRLRVFFADRQCLEVDVPVISPYTVTDLHLSPIKVSGQFNCGFLQTSPEYYLKRLLSHYALDVYYLGKAFRDDPSGKRHRGEFTILEWYRCGWDDRLLMDEVTELFQGLKPNLTVDRVSYQALFERQFAVNPHSASVETLQCLARAHTTFEGELSRREDWLDLLFSMCIEPSLTESLTLVYDYPACLAALARTVQNSSGDWVARRFEVFWKGIELANGYWELTDHQEQMSRFDSDLAERARQGLPERTVDQRFADALAAGLPDCAGIALGVDRLLMCLLDMDDIAECMAFANQ